MGVMNLNLTTDVLHKVGADYVGLAKVCKMHDEYMTIRVCIMLLASCDIHNFAWFLEVEHMCIRDASKYRDAYGSLFFCLRVLLGTSWRTQTFENPGRISANDDVVGDVSLNLQQ